jgi:hypothetical protein
MAHCYHKNFASQTEKYPAQKGLEALQNVEPTFNKKFHKGRLPSGAFLCFFMP